MADAKLGLSKAGWGRRVVADQEVTHRHVHVFAHVGKMERWRRERPEEGAGVAVEVFIYDLRLTVWFCLDSRIR
jgi:predicted dehydrogenase